MGRFCRLLLAFTYILSGSFVGLLVLEGILRCNPTLLQRGIALISPIDHPLTTQTYDVRYSDADVFYWRPDLIKPIAAAEDQVEAHVVYETDEFGFRNQAPIPPAVEAIVLGRSISLAAHLAYPWTNLLESRMNRRFFNLSQPGSGIKEKATFLRRFGLPHHPHWVIIEVTPSLDFLGEHTVPALFDQRMVVPVLQQLARSWIANQPVVTDNAIYPLPVALPGRTVGLTCCLHYLDFFSLDEETLRKSRDWAIYRRTLLEIVDEARSNDACVALLYVPTKPDVYFPLASHVEQLAPTLTGYSPLRLNADGWIEADPAHALTVNIIRQNALAGRDLIESLALENDLLWIDPNDALVQSVLDGQDPFMVYDSHWNQLGHQIVAETVYESLIKATCP
ncbi:MAG: hypothetical protein JW908_02385 [Anaerolineales bacterium]|nr:hypothetical protein [Anaerolineales bacterium]